MLIPSYLIIWNTAFQYAYVILKLEAGLSHLIDLHLCIASRPQKVRQVTSLKMWPLGNEIYVWSYYNFVKIMVEPLDLL